MGKIVDGTKRCAFGNDFKCEDCTYGKMKKSVSAEYKDWELKYFIDKNEHISLYGNDINFAEKYTKEYPMPEQFEDSNEFECRR